MAEGPLLLSKHSQFRARNVKLNIRNRLTWWKWVFQHSSYKWQYHPIKGIEQVSQTFLVFGVNSFTRKSFQTETITPLTISTCWRINIHHTNHLELIWDRVATTSWTTHMPHKSGSSFILQQFALEKTGDRNVMETHCLTVVICHWIVTASYCILPGQVSVSSVLSDVFYI